MNTTNWKTTALGVVTLLTTALGIVSALLAGKPVTIDPATIAAGAAGLGLIFAKDAK